MSTESSPLPVNCHPGERFFSRASAPPRRRNVATLEGRRDRQGRWAGLGSVHRGTKDDSAGAMARNAARSERRELGSASSSREAGDSEFGRQPASLCFTRLCPPPAPPPRAGRGDGCIDVAEKVVASPRVSSSADRAADHVSLATRIGPTRRWISGSENWRNSLRVRLSAESRWNNNAASDDFDERLTRPPPLARVNQIGHNARPHSREG